MKTSNLYRIHTKDKILQEVKEIDFTDFNAKERYDIQEWVESTPEILGEDLLIIGKEVSCFTGTKERLDLIALDKSGNLVIIELKRDDSGINVEWQAIKYSSYFSKCRLPVIVDIFTRYLEKKLPEEEISEEKAQQYILDFIDEDDFDSINKSQRIILVSHRFAKEVTTAVNWLIEKYEVDVKCVQLIPYFDSDRSTYYLQSSTILPIPGVEDMIIKASFSNKNQSFNIGPTRKNDEITDFFERLRDKFYSTIDNKLKPDKNSRWAGIGDNCRYYHFWYKNDLWDPYELCYKIWLFNEKASLKKRNRIGIYFEFSKKYLLNKGITESQIEELINCLKSIEINSFAYKNKGNYHFLEFYLKNNEISDVNMEKIIDVLIELVEKTKDKIFKIVKIS